MNEGSTIALNTYPLSTMNSWEHQPISSQQNIHEKSDEAHTLSPGACSDGGCF
jgi:hypothetical protein